MSDNPKAKIVLAGKSGVGKTAIIKQYRFGRFDDEELTPTVGANFVQKTIQTSERTIDFEIWDTAGQEMYQSLTSSFFNDANCAILVYDITSKDSLDGLGLYVDMAKEKRGNDCLYLVVGNKGDLDSKREVSFQTGQEYANEIGAAFFFEASAKNNMNIQEIFEAIASSDKLQFLQQSKISLPTANKGEKKKKCCQ